MEFSCLVLAAETEMARTSSRLSESCTTTNTNTKNSKKARVLTIVIVGIIIRRRRAIIIIAIMTINILTLSDTPHQGSLA